MNFFRINKRLLISMVLLCSGATYSWALPAEHEAQRLLQSASQAIAVDDMAKAAAQLERIQALGIEPPTIYYYYQGKVFQHEKRYVEAKSMYETYVVSEGAEGKFYADALNRITASEEAKMLEEQVEEHKAATPVAAKMLWQPQSDDDYLSNLRSLYLAGDDVTALVTHINTLLVGSPYYGTRIKNRDHRTGEDYRIEVSKDRELLVKRKNYDTATGPRWDVTKMDVYGIDPIIQFGCEFDRFVCWLYHPVMANQRWILLDRDDVAAEELSRAMSRLIRLLQKGSEAS